MFDYGYPLIRAIIQNGRDEKDMLSNRTEDLVGTKEFSKQTISIYPNPTSGAFTIEGEGVYSIYNTVGQLVKTVNVEGMLEVVLPSGLYFVRNDETTTKVVVE